MSRFPIPRVCTRWATSEIEIARTIFRSGESEYRIGGQVVRLLNVQELLSETGIGRALHTVVGQGQLEEVLQARPEERRTYIEEPAGLRKDPSPSDFKALQRVLYGLYALVKVHFAKEEEVYLPILEDRLTHDEAREMFEAMEKAADQAKQAVPAG